MLEHALNYVRSVDELLKMDEIRDEWKAWLTTPAAWLQFVTSNFTEEETKELVKAVLDSDENELKGLQEIITYCTRNPQELENLKSMSDMLSEVGKMTKD